MMIDAKLLPFDIEPLVGSNAWRIATPKQRERFISASVTFATVINWYINKYRHKRTVKGEFIACVLQDFYDDLLCSRIKAGQFDEDMEDVYCNNVDEYSEQLLAEAIEAKQWIKTLKKVYKKNKKKIKRNATSAETGKINLKLISSFSEKYRFYLDCRRVNEEAKREAKFHEKWVKKVGF